MNQTETENLQTMQFEGLIQDIEYPNPDKPEKTNKDIPDKRDILYT